MRILSITAGASGMYCGSCMRDNAVAAEMIRQGHDVVLLPLYTPTRTDSVNVSDPHVFFSGVSVYLELKVPFFRKARRWLDWFTDAPWFIKAVSGRGISTDPHLLGGLTVSMLQGEHGPHRKELDRLLEWLRREPAPDVVSLPYTLLIALARPLKDGLGCPVVCALQGEELFLDGLAEPYRSRSLELIRSQVKDVDAFLALSDYEAGFMTGYLSIPPEKIHRAPLGIEADQFQPASRPRGETFRIGYLARIAPEKGLHELCDAYRELRRREDAPPARLEVAGYLGGEYRGYLETAEQRMKEWGLGSEFHYHGEVDRQGKVSFLQSLDVLSVPCAYDEPKGIFLLEAMACGVPVVQPRRGSFPEIVTNTGGGLLVEPNDAASLANGLLTIWRDKVLAARLRKAGPEGVRRQYTVRHMANGTLDAFSGTIATGRVNT